MFLRYILKNFRRRAVTNALFCLLLVLAGALFALSAGLWYSSYKSERDLDRNTTTIAIPDVYAIRRYSMSRTNNLDFSEYSDYMIYGMSLEDFLNYYAYSGYNRAHEIMRDAIYDHVMSQINEKVYASGLLELDDRRAYGAYTPGIRSVPYRLTEHGISDYLVEEFPQFVAAFIVECTGVEETFRLERESNSTPFTLTRAFVADFSVEEDIYVHHGRRLTRTVTGYFPFTNPDGSAPVEAGKRYIVVGNKYSQSGGTYTNNPTWYNDLPTNRNIPNGLYIDILHPEYDLIETAEINALYEISDNILLPLMVMGIHEDSLPIIMQDRVPRYDTDLGYEGHAWFEIDGSLEEALASGRGEYISTALSVAEVSYNSLMVLTTNDVNSLIRFNQRTNRITEGRTLSERDISGGAQVCLISENLAELNNLSVGDRLPLQLYNSTFAKVSDGDRSAWPLNPYNPTRMLTEPLEYVIVGIYSGLSQEMNDYAISPNTVIIPAKSFGGIDEPDYNAPPAVNKPPLLYTIIVPNDKIEDVKAQIDSIAGDYSKLFRFYDQGYSSLKPILANLRFGMTWIMIISAIGWAIAVIMFSLFYTGRVKRGTSLLSGLGVRRRGGFGWVFSQCSIVIVTAQCIVLACTLPVFGSILDTALVFAKEVSDSYRNYTLSDMNIAGGLRFALPLDKTPIGAVSAVVLMVAALLLISGFISARAAKRNSLMGREAG